MSEPVHAIRETFCVLTPDMALQYLPFTGPAFYEDLDARFGDFAGHVLMSCHTFNAPWPTWECHPAGDEMVLLMSGTVTLALKKAGKDEFVSLDTPGQYVLVPRGIWHTATAASEATMLFITPGEGTLNLEHPPED